MVFTGVFRFFSVGLTASVILGFGLSLSSTAFALQYLLEKNKFNTQFGQSSFAILLSQDLLAIPALAIIPAIVGVNSSTSPSLFTVLLFFGLIILLVLLIKYLTRPVFRMIAATKTRELFTATTLLIVFGVAALTLSIGLSAALGTFIAGVLLAESEYRHELEANLDPFKSLLMGLFFISVGMTVSLPLIIKSPLLILGLSGLYILAKMSIIYGIARVLKLTHENSKLMSLAIGQGGEFAFVIFTMALSYKITSSEIIDMLTAIITVSMAISPVLNLINEKREARLPKNQPSYDEIKDDHAEVIIAGFGRFGQIFGRMFKSQGIPFVAIDHDADQVESLRKFGHKVYFGDASRKDILEMAGINRVRYFILAIDDMDQSLETAKFIKEHYPTVVIFARARNRGHVFKLMELGVQHIKRETFESSVAFVNEFLKVMGMPAELADKATKSFKTHDEILVQEQFKVHHNEAQFIDMVHQGQAQLTQLMEQESKQSYIDLGH